jgi:hypothetical protein
MLTMDIDPIPECSHGEGCFCTLSVDEAEEAQEGYCWIDEWGWWESLEELGGEA